MVLAFAADRSENRALCIFLRPVSVMRALLSFLRPVSEASLKGLFLSPWVSIKEGLSCVPLVEGKQNLSIQNAEILCGNLLPLLPNPTRLPGSAPKLPQALWQRRSRLAGFFEATWPEKPQLGQLLAASPVRASPGSCAFARQIWPGYARPICLVRPFQTPKSLLAARFAAYCH